MDDLIEALTIFKKYKNLKWPTHCEHDVLYIIGIDASDVSNEDTEKLEELGFIVTDEFDEPSFISFRFGSA